MTRRPWSMSDRTPRRTRAISRRQLLGVASSGTVGLVLTGCGGSQLVLPGQWASPGSPTPAVSNAVLADDAARFAQFTPADEPNGDLSRVVWPTWMAQLDPEIKLLYEFQILNGPLMRYMPCFCGCQMEDGHQNNRDCYIEAVNPDGSVLFDSMAPT